VSMMLEQLKRMGYLEELGGNSKNDICSNCSLKIGSQNGCRMCSQEGRAFILTKKAMTSSSGESVSSLPNKVCPPR
jgi:hypothetical protein